MMDMRFNRNEFLLIHKSSESWFRQLARENPAVLSKIMVFSFLFQVEILPHFDGDEIPEFGKYDLSFL